MFNPYRHQQQLNQPFSFQRLYSHPGSLDRYDSQGSRQSIGIIGGGIAGLTCAYELSQLDHQVTLLEVSGRLGGRIYTHYFSDGTHAEFVLIDVSTAIMTILSNSLNYKRSQ